MKLWGNGIRIAACIKKNTGKYILMGNLPAMGEFTGTFPSVEAARAAKEKASKIIGGSRCNSGMWLNGMTWLPEEVA